MASYEDIKREGDFLTKKIIQFIFSTPGMQDLNGQLLERMVSKERGCPFILNNLFY